MVSLLLARPKLLVKAELKAEEGRPASIHTNVSVNVGWLKHEPTVTKLLQQFQWCTFKKRHIVD
jgi:hypothetical protein